VEFVAQTFGRRQEVTSRKPKPVEMHHYLGIRRFGRLTIEDGDALDGCPPLRQELTPMCPNAEAYRAGVGAVTDPIDVASGRRNGCLRLPRLSLTRPALTDQPKMITDLRRPTIRPGLWLSSARTQAG
jgi:hypothetical protein